MEKPQAPEILDFMQYAFKKKPPRSAVYFPVAAEHYDTLLTYTLAIQEYRRSKGEHACQIPVHTRGPGYPLYFGGDGFGVQLQRREDITQPIPKNWRAEMGATGPSPRDDHESRTNGFRTI